MPREPKQCKQCGREIYFDGICISCRAENERREILELSPSEEAEKIEYICANIEQLDNLDEDYELCKKLINFRDINTKKLAAAAWDKGVMSYPAIFKDAPEPVINEMIDALKDDDTDPRTAGALLLCLAQAGGEMVFNAFLELERQPRKWRDGLHVDPSFYATYGGWSYDKEGRYLRTNFNVCYPMVKGTPEGKKKSPVKIGTSASEKCPHCGCRIVNLMEIDGCDPRLEFLGIDGVIKAKCCPNCFPWADAGFCRYETDGESSIIPYEMDSCEDYLGEAGIRELESNTYVLGDHPVPLRYAADWEGGSSIGGFAFWIQDCEIKHCPDCGRPMTYLAQIQWDTVLEGMEGNAYIEICKDCKVMAILHQQT